MTLADRAREVTEFLLREGRGIVDAWPVRKLFAYVFFHVAARTLFVVRRGESIATVAIAWAEPEADIRAKAAAGKPIFAWRVTRDDADAIMLAQVVGRRECLGRIVNQARSRWPDLDRRRVLTFRRRGGPAGEARLVELKPRTIARLRG